MTTKKTKAPAAKPASAPSADGSKQLVDAIVTVRHLQTFIQVHGGLEQALAAVTQVSDMVKLTGSFEALREALEIVGKEPA